MLVVTGSSFASALGRAAQERDAGQRACIRVDADNRAGQEAPGRTIPRHALGVLVESTLTMMLTEKSLW